MSALIQSLEASKDSFLQLGWLGVLTFALALVVLQMVLIPLSPAAIAAGWLYGFGGGLAVITIGINCGAVVNFLLARYVARAAIARKLAGNEKFRLIDHSIGREGWKIIALLRLCPIPFGLANYCYGLTAIRFWPYMFATFVATIPGNCLFVWLGSTAQEGLAAVTGAQRARHPGEYVLLGVGLLAAFCAMAYIARIAKAAVVQAEAAPDTEGDII